MDPKKEYEMYMRMLEAFDRDMRARAARIGHSRSIADQIKVAQIALAHEDAQDELLRMTSAFTQRDANKLLAECLERKK